MDAIQTIKRDHREVERLFVAFERAHERGDLRDAQRTVRQLVRELSVHAVIDAVASAGSFLDGGGSRPLQRAAVPLLEGDHVVAGTNAIHRAFGEKRALLLRRLEAMGIRTDRAPDGTFYVWGSVAALPPPLSDGMGFFRAALERKVICVPGEFFDVNPGKRRSRAGSRFRQHVRFSFGPSLGTLATALDRLEEMIRQAA